MDFENFHLQIPEGHEVEDGYVEMVHGMTYTILLGNSSSDPCDVDLAIDGAKIVTFRLDAGESTVLERPLDVPARFTFYRIGSTEAKNAALKAGDWYLELIEARFKPGSYQREQLTETLDAPNPLPNGKYVGASFLPAREQGGTGLSGYSGQRFGSYAEPITHLPRGQVVLGLRLVGLAAVAPLSAGERPSSVAQHWAYIESGLAARKKQAERKETEVVRKRVAQCLMRLTLIVVGLTAVWWCLEILPRHLNFQASAPVVKSDEQVGQMPTPNNYGPAARLKLLNQQVYVLLASEGMPSFKAEAKRHAIADGQEEPALSIEDIREHGGIGFMPMDWWESYVLNNERLAHKKRAEMRRIIEEYFRLSEENPTP
jgi:hypothetical protein